MGLATLQILRLLLVASALASRAWLDVALQAPIVLSLVRPHTELANSLQRFLGSRCLRLAFTERLGDRRVQPDCI